jgi:hypothetical protein
LQVHPTKPSGLESAKARSPAAIGALPKLSLPVFELRITAAEGKDGIGEGLSPFFLRVDSDQHCPVAASLNVPRIRFHRCLKLSPLVQWCGYLNATFGRVSSESR